MTKPCSCALSGPESVLGLSTHIAKGSGSIFGPRASRSVDFKLSGGSIVRALSKGASIAAAAVYGAHLSLVLGNVHEVAPDCGTRVYPEASGDTSSQLASKTMIQRRRELEERRPDAALAAGVKIGQMSR